MCEEYNHPKLNVLCFSNYSYHSKVTDLINLPINDMTFKKKKKKKRKKIKDNKKVAKLLR